MGAIDGTRIVNPRVLTERLVSPLFLANLERHDQKLCLMASKNTCQVYYYKNRFELSSFSPIKLNRDRNLEEASLPIDL